MAQNARNDSIDAHRFPASRRTGNQKMRHFREIGDNRASRNIFSERHRDAVACVFKFLRIQNIAQWDFRRLPVRHFDTHNRFPRNRRLDPNMCRRERHRDVILQTQNPAHFDAHRRLHFILRHRGTCRHIGNPHVHAEAFECRLQEHRIPLRIRASVCHRLALMQQSQRWKSIRRPVFFRLCLIRFFRPHFYIRLIRFRRFFFRLVLFRYLRFFRFRRKHILR